MMKRRVTLMAAGLRRPVLALPLAVGVVVALAAGASGTTRAGAVQAGAVQRAAGPTAQASASARVLAGSWKKLPAAPVGALPDSVVSVWTGREMIIHGIRFRATDVRRATFAYRPATNTWKQLPAGPRPLIAEGGDGVVWTGSQMLVIGLTSAAYNPATNKWHSIARWGPPSKIAGWTGHEAIMWSGTCCGGSTNSAAAYNPATNHWRALPTAPLQRRTRAMGTWTGKRLIVAGGWTVSSGGKSRVFRDAAAYTPATNTWQKLPPMPRPRLGGTAVWDGKEVLFLGGSERPGIAPAARGMAYNPATSHWRRLPAMQFARDGFAAVWTGHRVLVWGGLSGSNHRVIPPHGEAYNPATNRWTALPISPLHGRAVSAAVWTGRKMIVWGGYVPTATEWTRYLDGAVFTPRTP